MAESGRLTELTDSVMGRVDFPPPDHIVALSGGADSATLAYLTDRHGSLVSCVHVHHGLAASDRLATAAHEVAARISIPLEVVEVAVEAGPSHENQARSARYRALEQATSSNASVLMGHTRNDQAETVLMNLVRGAGSRGLAGIPWHRPPNFYRPFLDVTRAETREIATLAGLPFADDPLNDDLEIRRNLVRQDLIPRLETLNPDVVAALARTASQIGQDGAHLDDLASSVPISHGAAGATVAASSVNVLPGPLQLRVVRRMVALLRQPAGVTAAEFARIMAVFDGSSSAAEIEARIRFTRKGALVKANITTLDDSQ